MKKENIRLNVVADKEQLVALKELTNITSNQELINNALMLLAWAVKEKHDGNIVGSIDDKNDKLLYKEVIIQALENIKILGYTCCRMPDNKEYAKDHYCGNGERRGNSSYDRFMEASDRLIAKLEES